MSNTIFDQLAAEFPRDLVSWRCQTVSSTDKGLALAYIDARDVMRRLDAVVGPENWSDRYEVHGPKTICYLSIRIGDEWVVKADGAGDTDVEAEKGSISDAFKRAAVKWGIGRYLYDLDAPWVPCEVAEKNGKKFWKKWTADPWSFVRNAAPSRSGSVRQAEAAEQTTAGASSSVKPAEVDPDSPAGIEAALKKKIDEAKTINAVIELMLSEDTQKKLSYLAEGIRDEIREHGKKRLTTLGWKSPAKSPAMRLA
jgi:hypothetical protein